MSSVKGQFFLATDDGDKEDAFFEVRPIEEFVDEYKTKDAFVKAVDAEPLSVDNYGDNSIARYDRFAVQNMNASTAFQLVSDPHLLEITVENWPQIAEIILKDPPFNSFTGEAPPSLQELIDKGQEALGPNLENHGYYIDNLVQHSWPEIQKAMVDEGIEAY